MSGALLDPQALERLSLDGACAPSVTRVRVDRLTSTQDHLAVLTGWREELGLEALPLREESS